MRNKKLLSLIAVMVVAVMIAISGLTALGLNQPVRRTAFNTSAIEKAEHRSKTAVKRARSAVYKFNKRDFDLKKVHPLWNGKHPKTVPIPPSHGDKAI